jgi:hypothetical protein
MEAEMKRWRVRYLCCGAEYHGPPQEFATWEEADTARTSFVEALGVGDTGHKRAAIIEENQPVLAAAVKRAEEAERERDGEHRYRLATEAQRDRADRAVGDLQAEVERLSGALRELHLRATDPDVRRGVFGALFMLQEAAKEADRALSPSSEGDGRAGSPAQDEKEGT